MAYVGKNATAVNGEAPNQGRDNWGQFFVFFLRGFEMKQVVKSPFVSIRELAELLDRSDVTLRRWYRAGALPPRFGAGKLQWLRADLVDAGILPKESR